MGIIEEHFGEIPTLDQVDDDLARGIKPTFEVPMEWNAVMGNAHPGKTIKGLPRDITNLYPPIFRQSGPSSHKGGYCGYCDNLKKTELRKLDSCPVCGKSLLMYKSRGW